MSHRILVRTALLSAFLFLISGTAHGQDACCFIRKPPAATLEGTSAPALTLSDLQGHEVTFADLKGKVSVLSFWEGGWLHTDGQLTELNDLQTRHEKEGLRVVAIAMNEKAAAAAREWMGKHGAQCEVLRGDDNVGKQCALGVLPTTLVIDAKGIVAKQYEGGVPIDELDTQVSGLLRGSSVGLKVNGKPDGAS